MLQSGSAAMYKWNRFLGHYLHNRSRLGEDVVDGVDGDPHHGGEADAEANDLGPLRVVVVRPVLDGLVGVAVEPEHRLE